MPQWFSRVTPLTISSVIGFAIPGHAIASPRRQWQPSEKCCYFTTNGFRYIESNACSREAQLPEITHNSQGVSTRYRSARTGSICRRSAEFGRTIHATYCFRSISFAGIIGLPQALRHPVRRRGGRPADFLCGQLRALKKPKGESYEKIKMVIQLLLDTRLVFCAGPSRRRIRTDV